MVLFLEQETEWLVFHQFLQELFQWQINCIDGNRPGDLQQVFIEKEYVACLFFNSIKNFFRSGCPFLKS